MTFADHFSDRAAQYATFRPSYPPELIRWVAECASARRLAWDCGTGSGQAAVLLADHFDQVIASDASHAQIAAAAVHPRVRYMVAPERAAPIAAGSVDLVTVAQALHWFDVPSFFAEVDRVLVAGGVLAVWSYGKPAVPGAANDALQWFHDERMGPYWPSERMDVETGYRSLTLPYEEIPAPRWTHSVPMSLDRLAGYIATWSAVRQARLRDGRDPMPEFVARIAPAWPDADEQRTISWPLTVRACRRPGRR